MSAGRFKPLLATESGKDVYDFIDKDSFNKLAVADKAVLFILEEILEEIKKTNELLEILGENQ